MTTLSNATAICHQLFSKFIAEPATAFLIALLPVLFENTMLDDLPALLLLLKLRLRPQLPA